MTGRIYRYVILTIGTILLLSRCAGSRWASRVDWDEYSLEAIPDRETYPEAGAIVLLDEADLDMGKSGEMTFSRLTRHMIIKILNVL